MTTQSVQLYDEHEADKPPRPTESSCQLRPIVFPSALDFSECAIYLQSPHLAERPDGGLLRL